MLQRLNKLPFRTFATASLKTPGKSHTSLTVRIKRDQPEEAVGIASQIGTVANGGVTVASFDHQGPSSVVGVVLPAGSRYESSDAPGAASLYAAAILRNTQGRTALRTVRETELLGATISTTLTRDSVIVSGEFLRDALSDVVPALLQHALNNDYSIHEFQRAAAGVAESDATGCVDSLVLDGVHVAAYQQVDLGHSLYTSKDQLLALKRRQVRDHLDSAVKHRGVTVVGLGTSHSDLEKIVGASLANLSKESVSSTGAKSTVASKAPVYRGGDYHISAALGENGVAAVAYSSCSHTSAKELASALVLKQLLARRQPVHYGPINGSTTLLGKSLAQDVEASPFESTFSDASLFGVVLKGPSAELLNSARKFTQALKTLADPKNVDETLLAGARNAAVISNDPILPGRNKAQKLANLAAAKSKDQPELLTKALATVSAADIANLCKNLLKSAPSVSTVGNVRNLFHSFDLKG